MGKCGKEHLYAANSLTDLIFVLAYKMAAITNVLQPLDYYIDINKKIVCTTAKTLEREFKT